MAQVINTNIPSLNSQNNLNKSQSSLATSLQRLSSGLRINSAKDDAAGLAISDRMTSQIRGMDQAKRNANDGVSLSQTAEGALATSSDMLQRIRELAVQSVNGSNSGSDRQALNAEVSNLVQELDRVANNTEFNGLKLMNGSNGTLNFQVGANANQTIAVGTSDARTNKYGLNTAATSAVAFAGGAPADITAGTLAINGLSSASVTLTSADSAKQVADKINAVSEQTGVGASARTLASLTFSATGSQTISLASNNSTTSAVNITFNVGNGGGSSNTADDLSQAISEINKQTSKTGVTAKFDAATGAIALENSNGNSINIKGPAASLTVAGGTQLANGTVTYGTGAAAVSATFGEVQGTVTMDSTNGFSLSGAANANFQTVNSDSTNLVSTIDVSSADKATMAIRIVDTALANISSQRANYGAIQSRFENAISNLSTTSENVSASRSRIRDTDYAAETANLTRSQVLQQAGTAMLAQANALPNQVLSLLRG
jgi:flagellin